jgi:hypothetical protein
MFKSITVLVFTTLIYIHSAPGQVPSLEKQDSLFYSLFQQAFRYDEILNADWLWSADSTHLSFSDRLSAKPEVYRIVRTEVQTPRGPLTLIGGLLKRVSFNRFVTISSHTRVKSIAVDSSGFLYFLEGFTRDDRYLLARKCFGGISYKHNAIPFARILLQSLFPEYGDFTVVDSTNCVSLREWDHHIAPPRVHRRGGITEVTFVCLTLWRDRLDDIFVMAVRIGPGDKIEIVRKELPQADPGAHLNPKWN